MYFLGYVWNTPFLCKKVWNWDSLDVFCWTLFIRLDIWYYLNTKRNIHRWFRSLFAVKYVIAHWFFRRASWVLAYPRSFKRSQRSCRPRLGLLLRIFFIGVISSSVWLFGCECGHLDLSVKDLGSLLFSFSFFGFPFSNDFFFFWFYVDELEHP